MGSLVLKTMTSIKPMITPKTVIGHLEFLASHRAEITEDELPTRISEIKKAYEYLEEMIPTCSVGESALIWLNIENEDLWGMTLETFRNSWSRVCSFLGGFHDLLKHANARKLNLEHLRRGTPEPPRTQPPFLQGLLNLRENEVLCDVTMIAPPQTFKAHKIVLASVCDYWRSMFTSKFMESSTTEISLQDYPSTIKVLLDYIYTHEFKPPQEDDVTRQLENLLDQLEKSEKWFLKSFKYSMEHYLSDPHWIRPETVKSILKISRTYNANHLAQVCERYIEDNREIVEREAPNEE
ncbi:POZ domain-containing protein [Tuber magnatum]|uniref:POZ domain-containing protein n=1 Tax=Tuber magnatum TaxID=42249 RepID=A0A317SNF5_9PEZI|nr:POZ domain-containing protein [Tuber magnatum]